MTANGHTAKEIASELRISARTAEYHIDVVRKLTQLPIITVESTWQSQKPMRELLRWRHMMQSWPTTKVPNQLDLSRQQRPPRRGVQQMRAPLSLRRLLSEPATHRGLAFS